MLNRLSKEALDTISLDVLLDEYINYNSLIHSVYIKRLISCRLQDILYTGSTNYSAGTTCAFSSCTKCKFSTGGICSATREGAL